MSEPFEETVSDYLGDGGFTRRWLCEVPADDVQFQVLESEWSEDYTLQIVKKIRVFPELQAP